MRIVWIAMLGLLVSVSFFACSSSDNKCAGSFDYSWRGLIPGPGEAGFDSELAAVARRRDRQFHLFHTLACGVNAELSIFRDKTTERAAIESFINDTDGWDFEDFSGLAIENIIDSWWKVAGAYAGAGIAADAFRYGVMRDQCYPKEDVDRAREQLIEGLAGLHLAMAITGVPGVIARGFANTGFPGAGENTDLTPLFDTNGDPLPVEKNNGTWRADNSGEYPGYIWEDSCSRDMLVGWALGFGGAWEVIAKDADIPEDVKDTMRADARALAGNLMTVRSNGYDLELGDADGRTTFHGYLNENNIDRLYVDGIRNGFYTIMSLGIIGALADVASDPEIDAYLYDQLIDQREFAIIARDNMLEVNMQEVTNFSNFNMAFDGAWLALRHIRQDEDARAAIREAVAVQLYDTPGKSFQPVETGQSFFDLTYVTGDCDASSEWGCRNEPDQAAVDRAIQTLREFPAPPFWEFERINCDQQEIDSGDCVAIDGQTALTVLGEVGRNGDLIVAEPLPMRLRGPSNFYWRSNPYSPNGGSDGPGMFAGPDFRLGYWMGRWVRR